MQVAERSLTQGRLTVAEAFAVTKDQRKTFETVVADLNSLLRGKNRYLAAAEEEGDYTARLHAIKATSVVNGGVLPLPLGKVDDVGGLARFGFADRHNTVTWRDIADVKYRDAYDYTGHLPRQARILLGRLQHTVFDYRPAVLEGTLVRENTFRYNDYDPALVIRLGDGLPTFVVSYWNDRRKPGWLDWLDPNLVAVGFCALFTAGMASLTWGAPLLVAIPLGLATAFAGLMTAVGCRVWLDRKSHTVTV